MYNRGMLRFSTLGICASRTIFPAPMFGHVGRIFERSSPLKKSVNAHLV
jgi:hypothetical protein